MKLEKYNVLGLLFFRHDNGFVDNFWACSARTTASSTTLDLQVPSTYLRVTLGKISRGAEITDKKAVWSFMDSPTPDRP